MTTVERVEVTRRIAAPAASIYAIVSDPAGHVKIDASGMLVAPVSSNIPTAAGDSFEMAMDRTPLGDLPGVTDYTVCVTVTDIEQDRLFEWGVSPVGRPPHGYVYGYSLVPVDEHTTDVTSYFDWSGLSPKRKERESHIYPLIPLETLAASLERLESVVLDSPTSSRD